MKRITMLVAALALLTLPGFAADTAKTPDLDTQVQNLLAQVQALQKQVQALHSQLTVTKADAYDRIRQNENLVAQANEAIQKGANLVQVRGDSTIKAEFKKLGYPVK